MTVTFAPDDVERFRGLIAERLGLYFDDARIDYLAGIACQRVATLGGGAEAYLRRLASNDPAEVRALASQLTVGETYFFRYWDQFRAFTEVVLPDRARAARRLNILSAGCASGEEAYSLAILIREHERDVTAVDIKISGVDVNPVVVEKATRARYTPWSLRETPPALKSRYFHQRGGEFELDESIRSMVHFEQQNLLDDGPLWGPGQLDVVFCRNVIMYFTPAVAHSIVERIRRALRPGGYLFLGHAETLRGLSHGFHLRHTHETFYYQARESAAADSTSYAAQSNDARAAAAQTASSSLASSPGVDVDNSAWVEVIQGASDRIAKLAEAGVRPAAGGAHVAPSWDLGAAVDMVRQERFGDALDLVQALPLPSRLDPDAQLLRAILLTNSGQLAAAEQVCAQLLSTDDMNAGAHYVMALCREHAGDLKGALEHDLSATYLDTTFMMPHLHLGLLARRAGDLERARGALRRASALVSQEDASRILLFGGGFTREALAVLCRSELRACGGDL